MPLSLRQLAENDFAVIDAGDEVGRIRLAAERASKTWLWNITIPTPLRGRTHGTGADLEEAKADFKAAWSQARAQLSPEVYRQAMQTQRDAAERQTQKKAPARRSATGAFGTHERGIKK